MITGLDVGAPQGVITDAQWALLRADHRFVILRGAEALYATGDPTFVRNATASKAAGFARSVYCVEHPDLSAAAQADRHYQLAGSVGSQAGDLPPAIDMELLEGRTPAQALAASIDYAAEMVKRWGRPRVLFYSYPDFLARMLSGASAASLSELAELTDLWLARYAGAPGLTVAPWPTISFWQQSGGDQFRLPGGEPCDVDEFLGDEDDFVRMCTVAA